MALKRIEKILIIFLFSIVLFFGAIIMIPVISFVLGEIKIYANSPDKPPQSVAGINSNSSISLDIAVDGDHNIHLVSQSVENGIVYQKSKDIGETWSGPLTIYDEIKSKTNDIIDIIAIDKAISIFWFDNKLMRRTSTDGGISWSTAQEEIKGVYFNILTWDKIIYCVYRTESGFYLSRSIDLGLNWMPPILIAPYKRNVTNMHNPSFAINNAGIHIIFNVEDDFVYRRSSDFGDNWSDFLKIKSHRVRTVNDVYRGYRGPKIAANDETILLAYEKDGLSYLVSNDSGNTWSSEFEITKKLRRDYVVCAKKGGGIYIFWIDDKHMKKDWWGHIPFHFFITWDASPEWYNNDLYYVQVNNDQVIRKERLTLPLSLVDRHVNVIACEQIGSDVIAFWTGKRRVEKGIAESNAPNEIFFSLIYSDR